MTIQYLALISRTHKEHSVNQNRKELYYQVFIKIKLEQNFSNWTKIIKSVSLQKIIVKQLHSSFSFVLYLYESFQEFKI